MGMEEQGQPVTTAHGRSVNHDYRVCLSLHGVDHRVTVVHVCLCVCVSGQRNHITGYISSSVCVLGRETHWARPSKKNNWGARCKAKQHKERDT